MASLSWVANNTTFSPQRSFKSAAAFFHGGGVHAGEGLVQQQGVALGPESPQQRRPPLLPAGKLPRRERKGCSVQSKS